MNGSPLQYFWDARGNTVMHWTKGAKYTGKFSSNGRVLSDGWRPDKGVKSTPGNTYDATMTRLK
jgi:hypothetical protein